MKNKKYFGTDGVRGVANRGHIVPEFILRLGKAAGAYFKQSKAHPKIIIGKDTRLSGYMIESALMSGICAMGADVYFVGPLPTPAISFIVRSMRADAGIVISASHNPYTDNGIKFFGPDGRKLPDKEELAIEEFMESGPLEGPDGKGIGRAHRVDDAEGRYIAYSKATIDEDIIFEGLKIVVDCANGAAYEVAPKIFSELGAELTIIGKTPDGLNINEGCGSTVPEAMVKAVLDTGADVGIALDGDADRAILCDKNGKIVDGDDVLFLSSQEFQETGRLVNNTVIGTIMTNVGLQSALRQRGINLIRASYSDYAPTGDGIVTALQTVAAMVRKGSSLSALTSGWRRYPQIMINLRVSEKVPLDGHDWFEEMLDEARRELGEDHLLSLRYSGTEPLLRVTVSSESQSTTTKVCEGLCGRLVERFGWERT
jgi:phosphoglucosamine mutase